MKQFGLFITKRCNLKCKLCSGHIPYVKDPKDVPLETLKEIIDNYFACIDFVGKIVISGGETFLYAELPELLQYLYQYKSHFKKLELFTNGTILPKEECLFELKRIEECEEIELKIFVDDYGKDLSTRLNEVVLLLKENGITHTVRAYNKEEAHCGGWVDFGDLKTVLWRKEDERGKIKQGCAFLNELRGCFGTSNGILYPCTPARIQSEFGMIENFRIQIGGVNLLDDKMSIEQKREALIKMEESNWYSTCAYCKGMQKDSERFLPAEQLTGEELKLVKQGARGYQEVLEMKNRIMEEL